MSYPYTMRAAQRVLVAAQEWRDDLIRATSTSGWRTAKALADAVDDYRREVASEHVQGPDIDADAPDH